jgi:flagellar motor switch protein FliM
LTGKRIGFLEGMAQVLSKIEIDALLSGVTKPVSHSLNEKPDFAQDRHSKQVAVSGVVEAKPYDFSRSEISTRGRLPGLEVIFNDFGRRLQSMFASELGKSVDVVYEGMEVVTYEGLIQSFPVPASLHAVRLEPIRGIGIVVLEARLAFAMIELFFGGSGQKLMKIDGRDFTPIESKFLGKFVERMLKGMEESWQSVLLLQGRYLRTEINPYLLNAASPGDPMIFATFSITLSPISGTVSFSLPLAAISEFRTLLKSGVAIGDDLDNVGIFRRVLQPLLEIDVSVQAILDVVEMTVAEIMGLRAGDVIQLGSQGMDNIELYVEGKRKFLAKAGQRNGSKIVAIKGRINERACNR